MSKKTNQNNINKTTEKSLCTSCGICKSVCPVDAVEMKYISGQYLPQIKEDKCINCELCLKICPGYQVDYTRLYSYKNEKYPENIFVGNHEKCYTAYTKDDMIRKKSTSGGLITEIIIQLLKNKKYKKAFVVRSDPAESGEARLEAVSTEKEVLESAKSKYIPVSVENVIEYIKNNPEDKIVVVGTSCHFHGIYKFLMEEKREDDNILFLGLFCDRTLNYNLINYFEDYHLATGDRLKSFDYRSKEDKGWPGNLKISSQSNKEKFIDRKIRIWLKPYFTLNRCHFCIDKLNQFADISFGDCYIKGEESYLGKSNIIIRSDKGRKIFEYIKKGLEYKQVEIQKIIDSQNIDERRKNLQYDYVNKDDMINIVSSSIGEFNTRNAENRLTNKQKKLKLGMNYEGNKEQINNYVMRRKLKDRLKLPKKYFIKILDVLGLKDMVKKVLKGR